MSNFSWTCPHCEKATTITPDDTTNGETILYKGLNDNHRVFRNRFIVCPNPECKKYTLTVWLFKRIYDNMGNGKAGKLIQQWQLEPSSIAKVFPEYIPKPILDDYKEACSIQTLSPKASATLSRRCLQGIIRDFWGVKPGHLVKEIEQIKDKVDPLVWEAIDQVRKIGNIGAHMENDINVIVDVDPREAELLIGLIEMLLKEWYVSKEERKKRLESIVSLGKGKQEDKKLNKANQKDAQ